MSNRAVIAAIAASGEDHPDVAFLDPNQDAQVVNYDFVNVTSHLEGQQITFATGSASLVPIDASSTPADCLAAPRSSVIEIPAASMNALGAYIDQVRERLDAPIASSAEVLAASSPADCFAPLKAPRSSVIEIPAASMNALGAYIDQVHERLYAEEFAAVIGTDTDAPQTPPPKKSSGIEENSSFSTPLKRTDSTFSGNPFFQGCGGKIDFNSVASTSACASASAAYSESLLTKQKRGGGGGANSSPDSNEQAPSKRSRTVEELEEQLAKALDYVKSLEDMHVKHVTKQNEKERRDQKWLSEVAQRRRAFEDATASVLYSVFESFPSGPERADWLRGNLDDLRKVAEDTRLETELQALLEEENVHSEHESSEDDGDDDATTDGDNADAR